MNLSIAEEEKLLGNWPRRLLHVPTLVSYEWQPGNRYGSFEAPAYNALTYTWGRWRLDEHTRPEVGALGIDIKGPVTWPIPRIEPSHFTTAQFEKTIRKVIDAQPLTYASAHLERVGHFPVEFLWLDVACINQLANNPRSAAEIGRQAAIFEGAKNVFVWLTTQTHAAATTAMEALEAFEPYSKSQKPKRIDDQLLRYTKRLLSDPWFSSLWTLQEATLRKDAFFLSKDADLVTFPHSRSADIMNPTVLSLAGWLRRLQFLCDELKASGTAQHAHSELSSVLPHAGMSYLDAMNPLSPYVSSQHRTTTFVEDRIYGIQQIFRARLGKSAASPQANRHFSLAELEDQFGEHLLLSYPLLSQLHVFTKNVPRANRWRVNSCSVVTREIDTGGSVYNLDAFAGEQSRCTFSVVQSGCGREIWFHGLLVPLENILRTFVDAPQRQSMPEGMFDAYRVTSIVLDAADELQDSPWYRSEGEQRIPRREQKDAMVWLVQKYSSQSLMALLLGHTTSYEDSDALGVLLLNCGVDVWTRLGLVQWPLAKEPGGDAVKGRLN